MSGKATVTKKEWTDWKGKVEGLTQTVNDMTKKMEEVVAGLEKLTERIAANEGKEPALKAQDIQQLVAQAVAARSVGQPPASRAPAGNTNPGVNRGFFKTKKQMVDNPTQLNTLINQ